MLTLNDKRILIIGLSGENITRLVADEPIHFNGDVLGVNGDVFIFYGKNDSDLKAVLNKELGINLP